MHWVWVCSINAPGFLYPVENCDQVSLLVVPGSLEEVNACSVLLDRFSGELKDMALGVIEVTIVAWAKTE